MVHRISSMQIAMQPWRNSRFRSLLYSKKVRLQLRTIARGTCTHAHRRSKCFSRKLADCIASILQVRSLCECDFIFSVHACSVEVAAKCVTENVVENGSVERSGGTARRLATPDEERRQLEGKNWCLLAWLCTHVGG